MKRRKIRKILIIAWDFSYHNVVFILSLTNYLIFQHVDCQTLRNFPPLFNVAENQPIQTTPTQTSCGIPTQSAYCSSTSLVQSIYECHQEFCVQDCPRRTSLPSFKSLLNANGYGVCVTKDSVNRAPGSGGGDVSSVFKVGSECYLSPQDSPSLGANGAFTVSFWIWIDADSSGTILEKSNIQGTAVFRLSMSSSMISLIYNTAFGFQEVQFIETISKQVWTHIALQVFDVSASVFIDGVGLGFTPSSSKGLVGRIKDQQGIYRIGQNNQGGSQFVGRLQYLHFFTETLTNREIQEVYSGTLPPVRILTSCRCPPSHPRVKPLDTRYCIQNGVPDNFGDDIIRLNNRSHPLEYLNDGDSNSMWVSSFIDDITLTVDLQDQFQIFYVVLQFYSPQPKVVSIERQVSGSPTWQTWQFYAHDCAQAFNMINNAPLADATSVNCLQFGTNGLVVPYSKGNITFSVLASAPIPRPGHNDFYNTPALHELVNASKIRVRIQQHYYVTHPTHMYYGIYEFIVTGRCNCHGHGESCDTSKRPYKCNCSPSSNAAGNQCKLCKPLYKDKPFRDGDQLNAYDCKPCQCYGHAASCVYNQTVDPFPDDHERGGGGVCVDCKDNTEGRMCDMCKAMHFRPAGKSLYAQDVCSPCQCNVSGVDGTDLFCEKVGGQCKCKTYSSGRQCDQCQSGYYNLRASNSLGCDDCMCDVYGTIGGDIACHPVTGKCNCKANVRNLRCDACDHGFYNLTESNPSGCSPCLCNPLGSTSQFCNPLTGQCSCKPHISGRQCDVCSQGFFNFAAGCQTCDCDPKGSEVSAGCEGATGQCICKPHTTGVRCDQCKDGYYNLGSDAANGCVACGCDDAGTKTNSSICNKSTGECQCKENVQGRSCNLCKANSYNLTLESPMGCTSCGCDPSGTESGDAIPLGQLSCDHNTGQCSCLANRFGRRCEDCNTGSYISLEIGGGCLSCDCYNPGTIRLTDCDSRTGQCQCFGGDSGITGRRCDTCKELYFKLNPSTRSCSRCDCDVSGSVNDTCNANTGQCSCKDFTTGRQCGQCVEGTSNLQAGNPYGCSKAPSQQPPPSYEPINPTTLRLFWDPPDHPNGVILVYFIYRDGQKVAELNATEGTSYNDTGLNPFTDYQYQIEAVNSYGSTRSSVVIYRTPAGVPTGTLEFKITQVTTRSASFGWTRPTAANGIIQKYVLVSKSNFNPTSETMRYTGLAINVTISGLVPFTNYTFQLQACTEGGCLYSDWQVVLTGESVPEGQAPPTVVAVSSNELYVTWDPPEFANGIIIFYELWMRGLPGSGISGTRYPLPQRIFHPAGQYSPLPDAPPGDLPEPARNYTVQGLEGYTQYEFQVICENSLGKAASEWVVGRTSPKVPEEMPTPLATAVASDSINLTWLEPTESQARGVVQMYMVYRYRAKDGNDNSFAPPFQWIVLGTVTPPDTHYLVKGLKAYSTESFKVGLCNTVGCVNSTIIQGQTLSAAPADLDAPYVDGFNSSVMNITWLPPEQVNGPAPRYVVKRTTGAFNYPPPLVSKGTRFPGTGYYKFPSNTVPQGVAFTGISLWFKTSQRDALIMFAASEGGQEEFIALQIRAGRPWFLFDPQDCTVFVTPNISDHINDTLSNETSAQGTTLDLADKKWHHMVVHRTLDTANITVDDMYTGCSIIVTTTDDEGLPYNDNSWHYLNATRLGKHGTVIMDGKWTGYKQADCSTVGNIIGDNTGVYVGGLPADYVIQRQETDIRAQVIRSSFQGCLKDIKILTSTSPQEIWTDLDWNTVTERDGAMPDWEGCPDNLDVGYHFLGTGYTIYQSGIFTGGQVIDFEFYMRTELKSGLLFFAYGGVNVYYLIQVQDGGIFAEFSVTTVKQNVFLPNSEVNICDGAWHFIKVYKTQASLSVTVDKIYSRTGGDNSVRVVVNLASDFYIGGIKPNSDASLYIRNNGLHNIIRGSFGGCIRHIRINRRPYSIEQYTKESVNLNLDGCPAFYPSKNPCVDTLTQLIYNGTDLSALDYNRSPFTEYMYQIEAINNAGAVSSIWATGRTREGAPTGVYPPTSVEVISGYTLQATWKDPEGRTGRLSQFALKAYNLDDPSIQPVEVWFNASVFQGNMENMQPFTNYSVHLLACTKGGCGESEEGVNATTSEELPSVVLPPKTLTSGGNYILIGWEQPTQINGILTGYLLYQEGKVIYSGAETQFNVTELNMYTGYRFMLQACTRVGCANSSVATLTTSQLPPTQVNPPRITVLGTKRMEISWDHPDEINGVLTRYILYMSSNSSVEEQVVYNNTDLFTMTTLNDLVPGTTYYVRVAACTTGGCRISEPSMATTAESAPEGVSNPVVTTPNPAQLKITWSPPLYPNGAITMYRLYDNGLKLYNSSTVLEHTINNLQPWSRHEIRLEVCTAQGCASSETVQARTQEAPPQGTIGIDLRVAGAREVQVKWNAIDVPNGVIYYDVYFEGLFYVDPATWDYNVVTQRHSLLRTTNVSSDWVSVQGVIPHSTYYVQVNGSNTRGYVLSNVLQAIMPMGAPDGVRPPELTSPNASTVRATWQGVGRNNADLPPAFQLQFMETVTGAQVQNMFEQPSTATTFLKGSLKPFTTYRFRLVASNIYGETVSDWTTITTAQASPASIDPPIVSNVTSRGLVVSWGQPYQPNGNITQFKLYQNDTFINTFAGNVSKVSVSGLIPFTTYVYLIEVCTIAGCTPSLPSNPVVTLKAYPEGIAAPTLLSQTPTSVQIVWSEPEFPNGVLLQYIIQRRSIDNITSTLPKTFLPQDEKLYVDNDRVLTPYTTYEYRVGAYTEVGVGYGPWAKVTTKSSGPGGVFPPTVEILSPTSLLIKWTAPVQSNGRLESYVVKLPIPRFEIFNMSVTSLVVDNLVPYTQYTVTITACSDGGCTESSPSLINTSPALPDGLKAPVPTPHSQSFISIVWQPPSKPNGPNVRYELARSKVRQPLIPDAIDFGIWTSIYLGKNTYTEDRGLTMFTTYIYRLTVYNDFGLRNSNSSLEVTTFGGMPTKPALVSAYTVNHTAIEVRWEVPTVFELQGEVYQVVINITGFNSSQTVTVPGSKNTVVIAGLNSNTEYGALLTLVVHGGGRITSQPVYVKTTDGAPEDLSPPQLFALNHTALRLSWSEPSKPNGRINKYMIYLDGSRVVTLPGDSTTHVLASLKPYTVYSIQLEACTDLPACVKSIAIQATTAESVPAGLSLPSLSVIGPYSIQVSWQTPQQANGVILRYELYRKTKVVCTKPEGTDPGAKKCTYFECGVIESFCGDKCYSGPKTCCNGVLHDNKAGYECCDTSYIPQRANTDDICCGGNFHVKLAGHQCCGNRYLPVGPGEICCTDPTQDRVVVDFGDKCCSGIPHYVNNGSQICCNDKLVDKYGQQCCGRQVVSNSLQCCGSAVDGTAYNMDSRKFCCGSEYTESTTSVCCSDEVGKTQVHKYSSATELSSSNMKCCGTQRISIGLNCCNGVGYNPLLQSCADISNMDSGCGSGMVCSISHSSTSFCNQCNFDRTSQKCGSFSTKPANIAPIVIGEGGQVNLGDELCLTDPVKIYTGNELNFTDTSLKPHTEYQYSVTAVNGAGSSTSDYSVTTTSQTLPVGVQPPMARVMQGQLDTIYLTWDPPSQPNGEILWYIILRDTIEIFRNPFTREHKDNNAIQPYKTYTYVLRVCNGAGCVNSQPVHAATLQAKPSGVSPPNVQSPSPTSLLITWTEPTQPNGFITRYELYRIGQGLIANVSGNVKENTLTGLEAYGEYSFILTACTGAGCTNSTPVTARTMQDKPTGVLSPKLIVKNTTQLEIYWSKPQSTNGLILAQKLYRSEDSNSYTLIFMGGPKNFSYLDNTVKPGTLYQYMIDISTQAGGTNSTPAAINMPTQTPTNIPKPHNVTVLSSTELFIEWMPVNLTAGTIDQYRVLLNAGSVNRIERGVGKDTSDLVSGLVPHTVYEVRIQACVSGVTNGCGTGPGVTVTTFEAPPTNLSAPSLLAVGSSSIIITWKPPLKPNGIITQYRVLRQIAGQTSAGVLVNVVDGSVTQYTNTGQDLVPFTEYEYKIIAVNSKGEIESPWSRVRTLEAPPNTMSQVTIETVGAHSVTLSWQPPAKANGVILSFRIDYRVLSSDPTSQYPINSVSVLGSVLKTAISGLDPYTKYEIRVAAVNSAGNAANNWVPITTGQAAPSNLFPFTVEKISTGLSVILRWKAPGKPNGVVNNYLIYEEGNVNAVYRGLSREFEYRRLQPFTEYMVQLEVCTIGGCTRSPMQKFSTAEVPPQNQLAPTMRSVTATEVTLQWTKPLSSNGKILYFEVVRRQVPRIAKRQTSQPDVVYKTTDTQQTQYEYTDKNLKPHTNYEYMIRTVNTAGSTESPWQAVQTAQMAPTGLDAPVVSQVNNKYDQLSITWSNPAQANGIITSYILKSNVTTPLKEWTFAPTNPKYFLHTGLVAFTLYSYSISACTGGGCTESALAIKRTPQAPPFSIDPPTTETINSTAIKIKWTQPQVTNGQITKYILRIDNNINITFDQNLQLEYIVNFLVPYRSYTFSVIGCTVGGCTESDSVVGRPDEAPPTGMTQPVLIVTGSNSIKITWNPPAQANGIITSYEVKRDGVLIQTTQVLEYVDITVEPGVRYGYTVTAYNSKGSTTSQPAFATTEDSTPADLSPPILTPISSSVIRAAWSPPLKPNGQIYNYTLYRDNIVEFSANALFTDVTTLEPYTQYTFRVEACTSRGCRKSNEVSAFTLEAPPKNLDPPTLLAQVNSERVHAGVLVEWKPPSKPNGVITRYQIYRRNSTGLQNNIFTGPSISVHSMTIPGNTTVLLSYEDYDIALQPYTYYEYSVSAYNSEGQVRSFWKDVQTAQASPAGVPEPVVKEVTATTIKVEIHQPLKPNGIITSYQVAVDSVTEYRGTLNVVTLGNQDSTPNLVLTPYTEYNIQVGMCTAVGCSLGPAMKVTTGSAIPTGVTAPIAGQITPNSMNVGWKQPERHNSPSTHYELHWRQTCPYPYANQDDEIELPCTVGAWASAAKGQDLMGTTLTELLPYTSYELRLTVWNEIGEVDSTTVVTTRPTAPVYKTLPVVTPINNVLVIDWADSFQINAEVVKFILFIDGVQQYAGSMTKHTVDRASSHKLYKFQVQLKTTYGDVKSSEFEFNPATNDVNYVSTPKPLVTEDNAFYNSVWFISVVAILGLIIVVIGLVCCFIKGKRKTPYVRERKPLDSKASMKATPVYAIDNYGGGDVPNGKAAHLAKSPSMDRNYLHPGYINPSYNSSMSIDNGGLTDLHLDHMSYRDQHHDHGNKWDEDDEDVDSLLDGIIPTDSGLHSLAYGEDYESDRPMSVLREHMMFTDTHL